MKKLLISSLITSLLLPTLAFAAYNDASLTTDVVLSVNSITLNVSGTQATIQSIAVDNTSFDIVIQSGSSFQVTAPNLNQLSANTGQGQNVNTCNSSSSVLGYNLIGTTDTVTVTITPSSDLCADPTTTTSSSSSKGDARGGGGGGGTPALVALVVTMPNYAALTSTERQAMIAQVKTAIAALIQQIIILLQQQIAAQQ